MLQVFESLSNVAPLENVALEVAPCAKLHDIDF